MTTSFNTATASLAQMVAYFNTISPTPVKKFADRKSAIARIQAAEAKIPAPVVVVPDESSVYAFEVHGLTNCPSCGCHLSNGIGEHLQEVNGKAIKHGKLEFACLACGEEFGAPIRKASKKATTGKGTPKAKGVLLVPTVCPTEEAVKTNVVIRSRPVSAINEAGQVVVCCASTARKHGWKITGKLYKRNRKGSKAEASPVIAPTPVKASQKASKGTSKATAKRATRLETLEDLLG